MNFGTKFVDGFSGALADLMQRFPHAGFEFDAGAPAADPNVSQYQVAVAAIRHLISPRLRGQP